jgi:hypothetical protein
MAFPSSVSAADASAVDAAAVDEAIAYLERDPWEFRSGYAKAALLRRLKHVELSDPQVVRIERVLLHYVDVGLRWDFREACTLARRLDSRGRSTVARSGPRSGLRSQLRSRLAAADVGVAVRALTMLLALRRHRLSARELQTARALMLRWAGERDDARYLRLSLSIEKLVRRLWSNEWAHTLHELSAAPPENPQRRAARRLLKVAPRRHRR